MVGSKGGRPNHGIRSIACSTGSIQPLSVFGDVSIDTDLDFCFLRMGLMIYIDRVRITIACQSTDCGRDRFSVVSPG